MILQLRASRRFRTPALQEELPCVTLRRGSKAGGGSYALELAPADSSGIDDFANAGNVDVEAFVSPEIVVSPD